MIMADGRADGGVETRTALMGGRGKSGRVWIRD